MSRAVDLSRYAQMGVAAMLPGLIRAAEVLNVEIAALKEMLQAAQEASLPRPVGRPPKMLYAGDVHVLEVKKTSKKQSRNFWSGMTPEQRKAEMQRRYDVRRVKDGLPPKFAASTPTISAVSPKSSASTKHPGSSKWYASLSPEEKAAHSKKISVAIKKSIATKRRLATIAAKKKPLVNGHATEGVQATA